MPVRPSVTDAPRRSLATPTQRTSGLCPCGRLIPGRKADARSSFCHRRSKALACDADPEDVRALPGRPSNPRPQSRCPFVLLSPAFLEWRARSPEAAKYGKRILRQGFVDELAAR